MALVCYCIPNESQRHHILVSSPSYHISSLSHQSHMCFTSVVETESLISSLALFFLSIKLPQFTVEALGFSLFICNRGILEEKKKHKTCVMLGKSLSSKMYKYSMQLTQVLDSIRYVKHMEVFTTARPWQISPVQENKGAVILEKMKALTVIESLRGDAHMRKGT